MVVSHIDTKFHGGVPTLFITWKKIGMVIHIVNLPYNFR
jgi:hypothetical protein